MSFLYGDEPPQWKNFFYTATVRLAVCYPVAAVVSISVADVFSLLILLFWFLSGHWQERFDFIKRNSLVLAAIPFITLTFFGIFRDYFISGDYRIFYESLRYWWGHYPLFFVFILATLFFKKKTRCLMLSSINLSIVLIWILVGLFGTNLLPEEYRVVKISSLNLYRNYICFGMGLVLWTGLWICVPFTSKDIPLIRRLLPVSFLIGMKRAAQISPIGLLFSLRKPFHFPTIFFSLLRWGVVGFVCYYLFWINPSRTAQLAFLAAISMILVIWNWKKGSVLALLLCVSVIVLAHFHSSVFEKKVIWTINDVKAIIVDITQETDTSPHSSRFRTWNILMPSICEKPIFGYGMELGRKEVRTKTLYVDPHNEFINITLEFGLAGLGCFSLWLLCLFYRANFQPLQWRCFSVFVITALVIDCMNNCALSYNRESHLFCVLLAVFFVLDQKKGNSQKNQKKRL